MFEKLYPSAFACKRHRDGPFAPERERYLLHCAEQGATYRTQRQRSGCLLWFAERMLPEDRDGIDSARLHAIIHAKPSPDPSVSYALMIIRHARPWLKFLNWWRKPFEPIPFEEDLDRFVSWMRDERGLSSCTINQWRDRTATFLRWCGSTGRELATLRPEDIDAYFATYGAQRWSRISVGYVVSMLRVFLRHAASKGVCSSILADAMYGPRRYSLESLPSALSWNDVRRVIASAGSNSERDVRDRAILMLMAVYGLRRGEVAALRLDQIDWKARQLRILRLKRREPQSYPLVLSVAEALARYIDTARPDVPYSEVFIRLQAPRVPMIAPSFYRIISDRVHALNIKMVHCGPHALRHACATRLLDQGLSIKEIGDHLGHRSTSATMIYTKVDLAALREVGDFDLGGVQ